MNFNIALIAGYDVLADVISEHVRYVRGAVNRSIELEADLLIFLGGATNPDFPSKTEARANREALKKTEHEISFDFSEAKPGTNLLEFLRLQKTENKQIAERYMMPEKKFGLMCKVLSIGNTSAETLEAAKNFIEESKIPVNRLILCAEKSRVTGFMLDALMVGLLDIPEEILCYGHPFSESKQGFASQRKKMLLKVLSHRSAFFRRIREIKQKNHQHKVARLKRKQK